MGAHALSAHEPFVALVAEDSAAIRGVLAAMLLDHGVDRVLEAGDGAEALALMRQHQGRVGLLFCDLNMPGIDGVDVLRRVALAHHDTAVVVFSALEPRLLRSVADMADALGLEVLGVLGKPFSEAEIQSLLDRYRHSRRRNVRLQKAELSPGEIDAALREDRIDVYYQPKTRMRDGAVVGVEALARLYDPHLGILGPASFIPVAEACQLIEPITLRVLEKALAQAGHWRRGGMNLTVAVNLAPAMLRRLDLPDTIAAIAQRHGVPPDQVTLEVTEGHVEVSAEMLHSVSRLRLKGFMLSVDDFGTGDSGLYRLKSLPFTELKIDRGFVAEAQHRDDLRSVLETSIDLGHRLRLSVVAEGVESWEQWNLLDGIRCDVVQGFLAAPAMPPCELPRCLEQWRARLDVARTAPVEVRA